MLKAAPVPQQLTPLLQEVACHVDGIFAPLLPVTGSKRGCRQMLHLCLLYCLAPSQDCTPAKSSDKRQRPPALQWPRSCSDWLSWNRVRPSEEAKRLEGLRSLRVQSDCSNPIWQVVIDGCSGGAQVLTVSSALLLRWCYTFMCKKTHIHLLILMWKGYV